MTLSRSRKFAVWRTDCFSKHITSSEYAKYGAPSNRTTYAYDTLGRMTSRHHPDADGAAPYK